MTSTVWSLITRSSASCTTASLSESRALVAWQSTDSELPTSRQTLFWAQENCCYVSKALHRVGGSHLIKQEHCGVAHERSRNGNTLLLAPRQGDALLAAILPEEER